MRRRPVQLAAAWSRCTMIGRRIRSHDAERRRWRCWSAPGGGQSDRGYYYLNHLKRQNMDRLRPVWYVRRLHRCVCSAPARTRRRAVRARRAPGLAAAWPSLSRRAVRVRLVRRVRDACAAIVPPVRATDDQRLLTERSRLYECVPHSTHTAQVSPLSACSTSASGSTRMRSVPSLVCVTGASTTT